ncbi:MAG: hypothetical protein AAF039_09495 [Bacteroidota bacterium]
MKKNANGNRYWLLTIFTELGNHALSLFFIFLVFMLLWNVPQINDLILVINQGNHWLNVPIFYAVLIVFAFLISHIQNFFNPDAEETDSVQFDVNSTFEEEELPSLFRISRDAKERWLEEQHRQGDATYLENQFEESQTGYIKRMLPKMLGTIFLLIAAFGVNETYGAVHCEKIISTWWLSGAVVLLVVSLNKNVARIIREVFSKIPKSKHLPLALAIGCFLLIVLLGTMNEGDGTKDIAYLFISMLLLSMLFLLIVTSYDPYILWVKNVIGFRLIMFLLIFTFLLYLVLVAAPWVLSNRISPLDIVMVCVLGFFLVVNVFKFIGYRLRFKPLYLILIAVGVLVSVITANRGKNSHYEVPLVKTKFEAEDRMHLDIFINRWVDDRRSLIAEHDSINPFPIILVSAEGGGSRAGLWSMLVQSYLYHRNPMYFDTYLFSISGASGGGVGNNMFYTQAYMKSENKSSVGFTYGKSHKDSLKYRASTIFNKDFLSTSVASLLGRDLFKNVTNLGDFKDRGKLLEIEWERAFNRVFKYDDSVNPLGQSYLELRPKMEDGRIKPLLITNTTHLQSGQRAVISPVNPQLDTLNMGVFMDLLDSIPTRGKTLKRSTAMSLNARFPYISAVGKVRGVGQFADAGYYDNIGGSVTYRLQKALQKRLAEDDTLNGKFRIRNLIITNYAPAWNEKSNFCDADSDSPFENINYRSQLIAPALTIWNATFAHPIEMERTLLDTMIVRSRRRPIGKSGEVVITPVIPLGRFLSMDAARSMEASLDSVSKTLDNLIPSHK